VFLRGSKTHPRGVHRYHIMVVAYTSYIRTAHFPSVFREVKAVHFLHTRRKCATTQEHLRPNPMLIFNTTRAYVHMLVARLQVDQVQWRLTQVWSAKHNDSLLLAISDQRYTNRSNHRLESLVDPRFNTGPSHGLLGKWTRSNGDLHATPRTHKAADTNGASKQT
jgi:hypothetical protein